MGEENKEEEKKEQDKETGKKELEQEKKKNDEKKEEEEPPEIVFKVDMHCEACARKVARALKGFEGVEEVIADSKASKVVVKGKAADPIKVCERLQKKSGRKVELISPLPNSPEDEKQNQQNQQNQEQKKEEPPAVITVVLKVRMHCEACAQVIQKRIRKIKGVESVETNLGNDLVIVKGGVHPSELVDYVYKRTRRQVSIVKEEEKKKEKEEKEEENKESGEEISKEEEDSKTDHIHRTEYWPSMHVLEYANYYPPPQIFSDENPNACSVM